MTLPERRSKNSLIILYNKAEYVLPWSIIGNSGRKHYQDVFHAFLSQIFQNMYMFAALKIVARRIKIFCC